VVALIEEVVVVVVENNNHPIAALQHSQWHPYAAITATV